VNWSDEILMAWVDGELDEDLCAALEHDMTHDAALRQRAALLRAQRDRVAAAFAPVLDEPVPERLTQLLQAAPAAAGVVDLAAARTARAPRERGPSMPTWAQWGGVAASVLVGVLLGTQLPRQAPDPAIGLREGQLVAGGAVEQALSSQLASEVPAGAPVAVQLSFVDKGGAYCRTFSTATLAGLACQHGGQWTLRHLVAAEAAPQGTVRQAATALPRALLEAVDQQIEGEALDAERERQARTQGWRR
jgi:hypothetical protein